MRLGLLESVTQLNSHALSGIPLAFSFSLSIYVTKYAFHHALRLSRDRFGLCRLFQHSVAKTGNRRTDSNRDQVQQYRAYRIWDQ